VPNREWRDGEGYNTWDNIFIPSITELGYIEHKDTHPIGYVYQ